jgi:predicted DNA-binding transcriptional regulator AlpA
MYRFKEINALTGLSRHQIRDLYRKGEFPMPSRARNRLSWERAGINKWLRSHG